MPWPELTASCKFNYAAKKRGGKGGMITLAITVNRLLEAKLIWGNMLLFLNNVLATSVDAAKDLDPSYKSSALV